MNRVANMVAIDSSISVITLNVNDPNTPMKKERLSEWIKQQDPNVSCLQEILFKQKEAGQKLRERERYTM